MLVTMAHPQAAPNSTAAKESSPATQSPASQKEATSAAPQSVSPSNDNPAFAPDQVALTVAGKPVTVGEYTATLKAAGAPLPQNLAPAERRREAESYTNLLVLSELARKRGLDKTAEMQDRLRLQQQRLLASAAYRELVQQANEVPQASLEQYYRDHSSDFDQLHLQRLFVRSAGPNDVQTARTKAEDLHKRAAAGADFDQLAKELANSTSPVSSDIGLHTPGTLGMTPENSSAVFRLQPGQVSAVLQEQGGFFLYKATERKHMTLAEATPMIRQKLMSERLNQAMEQAKHALGVQLNSGYFDAPAQPRPNPPSPRALGGPLPQPQPPSPH
jgi:hypothetical protein